MRSRLSVLLATGTLVAASLTAAVASASPPGPGTFTTITTPSHNLVVHYDTRVGATDNHFVVSGKTSAGVTNVDIVCLYLGVGGGIEAFPLASAVPVTDDAFSGVAVMTQYPTNCRLRAIPTGSSLNDYLGSYTGPILYAEGIELYTSSSSIVHGYYAFAEQADGIAVVEDAEECGVEALYSVVTPSMQLDGQQSAQCVLELPSANVTAGGNETASAIRVDGFNAYLPGSVYGFLPATVAQTRLTTTYSSDAAGDATITESAPLVRCSVSNTYPPTGTSCPSAVATGVTFTRVVNLFRGAHQVRIRDTFTSTNGHAHTVSVQYTVNDQPAATGSIGYIFPGHSSTYAPFAKSQLVTGLGAEAGTMLLRSDMYSMEGDVAADTLGFTWSRGPSSIQFAHDATSQFGLNYTLTAPAGGAAHLGFAVSEHVTTAATKTLAATALGEMVNVPVIASPAAGHTVTGHSTTVSGTVTSGANGLPTSVTVNGHTAHLSKRSATEDSYEVTFTESYAKHVITVTAHDSAGNSRAASVTIHNAA